MIARRTRSIDSFTAVCASPTMVVFSSPCLETSTSTSQSKRIDADQNEAMNPGEHRRSVLGGEPGEKEKVGAAGLEPAKSVGRQLYRLVRLPLRHAPEAPPVRDSNPFYHRDRVAC